MAFKRAIQLPNGASMPIIGLGTWLSNDNLVNEAVKTALSIGYRHIDTAHIYSNETEVGVALNAAIENKSLTREDVFITTKLWNTKHHPDDVEAAFQHSLSALQTDYVDLYLIHWPMGYKRGAEDVPKDENGKLEIEAEIHYTDTWKAMEKLMEGNQCRAIGLSNFNLEQVKEIQAIAKVPISNLQIELHPYLCQEELVKYCQSQNISVTAYSPLGSPQRPWVKETDPRVLDDPVVVRIAKARGVEPAQVLIRFAMQRGIICIPKSVTPSRIKQNLETLDFELTTGDMKDLFALDRNCRMVAVEWIEHPLHPFPPKS